MGKPPTTDQELTPVWRRWRSVRTPPMQRWRAWVEESARRPQRGAGGAHVTTGEPPPAWRASGPRVAAATCAAGPHAAGAGATAACHWRRLVVITLDGTQHHSTQDGGTDLGEYADPKGRFIQRCIAATIPPLPDFR